ncbi:MAG: phosphoribosyltransferase family protein [Pseudomonadota bacterium]
MSPDILHLRNYSGIITVGENGVIDTDASPEELRAYSERLKRDRRITGVLIPKDCLKKRVSAMAGEIARDYPADKPLHVVVVLTGAIFFAADLSRELYDRAGITARLHLIKTSVYNDTIKKPDEFYRAVKLEHAPKDIEGEDILVIEDILDQGFTLTWLKKYLLLERKVSSARICCLLDKILKSPSPEISKMREQLRIDYTGFRIPDLWVAGYGVDAAQDLRNLPCIASVNEFLYR